MVPSKSKNEDSLAMELVKDINTFWVAFFISILSRLTKVSRREPYQFYKVH